MSPAFPRTRSKFLRSGLRLSVVAPALLVMILPNAAEPPDSPAKSGIRRCPPARAIATVDHYWLVNTDCVGKALSAADLDDVAGNRARLSDVVPVTMERLGPEDQYPSNVTCLPAGLCGRGPPAPGRI